MFFNTFGIIWNKRYQPKFIKLKKNRDVLQEIQENKWLQGSLLSVFPSDPFRKIRIKEQI